MTTFSNTGSGAVLAPRGAQKALEQEAIERFLARASALGITPRPLSIKLLGGGLMGLWETAGTFRVSWSEAVRVGVPGVAGFSMRMPRSGVFTKYNADNVLMSVGGGGLPAAAVHPARDRGDGGAGRGGGPHTGGEGGRSLVRGVSLAQAALRALGRRGAAHGGDSVAGHNAVRIHEERAGASRPSHVLAVRCSPFGATEGLVQRLVAGCLRS